MAACIKYSLLLLMCLCALHRGYANEIDRLKTKEDVRKFLAANLGEKGFFSGRCSQPVSCEKVKEEIENDTSYHHPALEDGSINLPFNYVTWALDNTDWHFYKADIDGNGYTDMVIDAGMVIVIMDMGGNIEGHVVSITANPRLYGFKDFISLPDGTSALVLRHDHNPDKLMARPDQQGKIAYITDTLAGDNTNPGDIKIDTLSKIMTGIDTLVSRKFDRGSIIMDTTYASYADTVDMRLYNMADTIVYKFYGFTVYKPGFKPVGISKIVYYYEDYGTVTGWVPANSCLEINKNGKCLLRYLYHEPDTTFSAMLDSTRSRKLWRFMSGINVKPINERNSCVAIDGGEGAIFAFYFDDGTVKKMEFWNCRLPMGLGYLSKAISDISEVLNWQLSETNGDFQCPCVLPYNKNEEGDFNCEN